MAVGGRINKKWISFERSTNVPSVCPTQSTNLLWKEYDKFERGLNPTTVSNLDLTKIVNAKYSVIGQKFLQDQSPTYVSARSSFVALQKITQSLHFTTLPVLPPASGFAGHEEYVEQLETWKRWIEWEKGRSSGTKAR